MTAADPPPNAPPNAPPSAPPNASPEEPIRLITDGRRLRLPDGRRIACAMGRSGLIPAAEKREGDGATPTGRWRLTRVHYRADRLPEPACPALPVRAITPADRWCDDPVHPDYNRLVRAPFPASCETLFREDGLYDLIVETDHNTDPIVPGAGSAIFLHCISPEKKPTAGCIAIPRPALQALLAAFDGPAVLEIVAQDTPHDPDDPHDPDARDDPDTSAPHKPRATDPDGGSDRD